MMHKLTLVLFSVLLFGCSATTTTAMEGVQFGKSQAEALEALEKSGDDIVSQSDAEIVAVGMWSKINQVRRKVLLFENGELVSVAYDPLEKPVGE